MMASILASAEAKQAISSPATYMKAFTFVKELLPSIATSNFTLPILSVAFALTPKEIKVMAANALASSFNALTRLWGPDNVDRHGINLTDLQATNARTLQILQNYPQLKTLLARLAEFRPSLHNTSQGLVAMQAEASLSPQQVSLEIQAQPKINMHEVESSILYFMAELENQLSIHGENITAFPPVIEELKETEVRLNSAVTHLQDSKRELQKVLAEVTELGGLIVETGLEQDHALTDLMTQAQKLITKTCHTDPTQNLELMRNL
jgi:hypothetical protein